MCAQLSGAAYAKLEDLEGRKGKGKASRLKQIGGDVEKNLHAFESHTHKIRWFLSIQRGSRVGDRVIISIRGTTCNTHWLGNMKTRKKPVEVFGLRGYPGREIHTGFGEMYNEFRQQMLTLVMKQLLTEGSIRQVLVTGHSLGGALATIVAVGLKEKLEDSTVAAPLLARGIDIRLYTFGAPRVGTKAFATYANQLLPGAIFRVVNNGDVVPTLPPALFGFVHTAHEIFFPRPGQEKYLESNDIVNNGDEDTSMPRTTNMNDADLKKAHGLFFNTMIAQKPGENEAYEKEMALAWGRAEAISKAKEDLKDKPSSPDQHWQDRVDLYQRAVGYAKNDIRVREDLETSLKHSEKMLKIFIDATNENRLSPIQKSYKAARRELLGKGKIGDRDEGSSLEKAHREALIQQFAQKWATYFEVSTKDRSFMDQGLARAREEYLDLKTTEGDKQVKLAGEISNREFRDFLKGNRYLWYECDNEMFNCMCERSRYLRLRHWLERFDSPKKDIDFVQEGYDSCRTYTWVALEDVDKRREDAKLELGSIDDPDAITALDIVFYRHQLRSMLEKRSKSGKQDMRYRDAIVWSDDSKLPIVQRAYLRAVKFLQEKFDCSSASSMTALNVMFVQEQALIFATKLHALPHEVDLIKSHLLETYNVVGEIDATEKTKRLFLEGRNRLFWEQSRENLTEILCRPQEEPLTWGPMFEVEILREAKNHLHTLSSVLQGVLPCSQRFTELMSHFREKEENLSKLTRAYVSALRRDRTWANSPELQWVKDDAEHEGDLFIVLQRASNVVRLSAVKDSFEQEEISGGTSPCDILSMTNEYYISQFGSLTPLRKAYMTAILNSVKRREHPFHEVSNCVWSAIGLGVEDRDKCMFYEDVLKYSVNYGVVAKDLDVVKRKHTEVHEKLDPLKKLYLLTELNLQAIPNFFRGCSEQSMAQNALLFHESAKRFSGAFLIHGSMKYIDRAILAAKEGIDLISKKVCDPPPSSVEQELPKFLFEAPYNKELMKEALILRATDSRAQATMVSPSIRACMRVINGRAIWQKLRQRLVKRSVVTENVLDKIDQIVSGNLYVTKPEGESEGEGEGGGATLDDDRVIEHCKSLREKLCSIDNAFCTGIIKEFQNLSSYQTALFDSLFLSKGLNVEAKNNFLFFKAVLNELKERKETATFPVEGKMNAAFDSLNGIEKAFLQAFEMLQKKAVFVSNEEVRTRSRSHLYDLPIHKQMVHLDKLVIREDILSGPLFVKDLVQSALERGKQMQLSAPMLNDLEIELKIADISVPEAELKYDEKIKDDIDPFHQAKAKAKTEMERENATRTGDNTIFEAKQRVRLCEKELAYATRVTKQEKAELYLALSRAEEDLKGVICAHLPVVFPNFKAESLEIKRAYFNSTWRTRKLQSLDTDPVIREAVVYAVINNELQDQGIDFQEAAIKIFFLLSPLQLVYTFVAQNRLLSNSISENDLSDINCIATVPFYKEVHAVLIGGCNMERPAVNREGILSKLVQNSPCCKEDLLRFKQYESETLSSLTVPQRARQEAEEEWNRLPSHEKSVFNRKFGKLAKSHYVLSKVLKFIESDPKRLRSEVEEAIKQLNRVKRDCVEERAADDAEMWCQKFLMPMIKNAIACGRLERKAMREVIELRKSVDSGGFVSNLKLIREYYHAEVVECEKSFMTGTQDPDISKLPPLQRSLLNAARNIDMRSDFQAQAEIIYLESTIEEAKKSRCSSDLVAFLRAKLDSRLKAMDEKTAIALCHQKADDDTRTLACTIARDLSDYEMSADAKRVYRAKREIFWLKSSKFSSLQLSRKEEELKAEEFPIQERLSKFEQTLINVISNGFPTGCTSLETHLGFYSTLLQKVEELSPLPFKIESLRSLVRDIEFQKNEQHFDSKVDTFVKNYESAFPNNVVSDDFRKAYECQLVLCLKPKSSGILSVKLDQLVPRLPSTEIAFIKALRHTTSIRTNDELSPELKEYRFYEKVVEECSQLKCERSFAIKRHLHTLMEDLPAKDRALALAEVELKELKRFIFDSSKLKHRISPELSTAYCDLQNFVHSKEFQVAKSRMEEKFEESKSRVPSTGERALLSAVEETINWKGSFEKNPCNLELDFLEWTPSMQNSPGKKQVEMYFWECVQKRMRKLSLDNYWTTFQHSVDEILKVPFTPPRGFTHLSTVEAFFTRIVFAKGLGCTPNQIEEINKRERPESEVIALSRDLATLAKIKANSEKRYFRQYYHDGKAKKNGVDLTFWEIRKLRHYAIGQIIDDNVKGDLKNIKIESIESRLKEHSPSEIHRLRCGLLQMGQIFLSVNFPLADQYNCLMKKLFPYLSLDQVWKNPFVGAFHRAVLEWTEQSSQIVNHMNIGANFYHLVLRYARDDGRCNENEIASIIKEIKNDKTNMKLPEERALEKTEVEVREWIGQQDSDFPKWPTSPSLLVACKHLRYLHFGELYHVFEKTDEAYREQKKIVEEQGKNLEGQPEWFFFEATVQLQYEMKWRVAETLFEYEVLYYKRVLELINGRLGKDWISEEKANMVRERVKALGKLQELDSKERSENRARDDLLKFGDFAQRHTREITEWGGKDFGDLFNDMLALYQRKRSLRYAKRDRCTAQEEAEIEEEVQNWEEKFLEGEKKCKERLAANSYYSRLYQNLKDVAVNGEAVGSRDKRYENTKSGSSIPERRTEWLRGIFNYLSFDSGEEEK